MQETKKRIRVRTGAKNLENGTPWFRAKDHNCLDAAAREAILEAVKFKY